MASVLVRPHVPVPEPEAVKVPPTVAFELAATVEGPVKVPTDPTLPVLLSPRLTANGLVLAAVLLSVALTAVLVPVMIRSVVAGDGAVKLCAAGVEPLVK